ncbi:MAG: hypothetical protein AAFR29_03780 [Pseudomonadota bacterium]
MTPKSSGPQRKATLIAAAFTLWAIAYSGLVWFSFSQSSPEALRTLVETGVIKPAYADYIAAIPPWVRIVTVVLAGLRITGGIGLFWRQRWCVPVYRAALLLTAIIMIRGFVFADVASVIRPSQIGIEILFIVISIFAVLHAYRVTR